MPIFCFVLFCRDRVSLCWPGWQIPSLELGRFPMTAPSWLFVVGCLEYPWNSNHVTMKNEKIAYNLLFLLSTFYLEKNEPDTSFVFLWFFFFVFQLFKLFIWIWFLNLHSVAKITIVQRKPIFLDPDLPVNILPHLQYLFMCMYLIYKYTQMCAHCFPPELHDDKLHLSLLPFNISMFIFLEFSV